MKILVIDDNPIHLDAAKAQLKEHDLTVAGSYKDAVKYFETRYDDAKVAEILAAKGIVDKPPYGWDPDYRRAKWDVQQQLIIPFDYDVVLVDLLMPAPKTQQGPDGMRFVGQEMPIGIFLALLAAKCGAKHVAVFTDSDHHSHPASACFDAFNPKGEGQPTAFAVEGAKVTLCNNRNWIKHVQPDNLLKEVTFEEWHDEMKPHVRVKDWAALLKYLVKGRSRR